MKSKEIITNAVSLGIMSFAAWALVGIIGGIGVIDSLRISFVIGIMIFIIFSIWFYIEFKEKEVS